MSIMIATDTVNLCEGCNTPIEWLQTQVTADTMFETWTCPNCERETTQLVLPTPVATGVELT